MKRNDELLNNTIVIAIGNFTTKLLAFLLVPFYTLWLSPEDYGTFDLLITYISFFIPFVTFQLEQAIFRYCAENKKKSKEVYINALHIILLNMVICNFIIFFIMKRNNYILSFLLYFNTYTLYMCSSEYLRGIGKLKKYSLINIIVSICIVILNIILVYYLKLQVSGMLFSYGIAYFVGEILILFNESLIDKDFFKLKNKNIKAEMIKYSLPLIPNSISWWITNVSDRTIINIVLGSFYNGIYAVVCKIPMVVNLLFSVFNLSWQQTAINSLNDENKNEYYNWLYRKLIKFLYTSGFCILVLSEFIFRFIFSQEYYQGVKQIPFLLNGIIFLSLAQFLTGILLANKETKKVGKSTIIAAIVNLIVNISMIKIIGLYAASISTLVSYIVMFAGRLLNLRELFDCKSIVKMLFKYNLIFIAVSIIINTNNLIINIAILILSILLFLYSNIELIKKVTEKIFWRKKSE